MKIIIFAVGIILSLWVGFAVHSVAEPFVTGVQKVYLQSRAIQKTVVGESGTVVVSFADAYREMARMFGIEVAEKTAKQEITASKTGATDLVDKLFSYDIAFWVSVGSGLMTLSLYLNIVGIITFLLKPITFFIK